MADPNGGPKPDAPPRLNVLAQYIKDFSFENPNAPQSLSPGQQPSINIQINVNARPLAQTDVEVELKYAEAIIKAELILQPPETP